MGRDWLGSRDLAAVSEVEKRYTARMKAEIVAAIKARTISRRQALREHNLSKEELRTWEIDYVLGERTARDEGGTSRRERKKKKPALEEIISDLQASDGRLNRMDGKQWN
jgi:hypothetical protein